MQNGSPSRSQPLHTVCIMKDEKQTPRKVDTPLKESDNSSNMLKVLVIYKLFSQLNIRSFLFLGIFADGIFANLRFISTNVYLLTLCTHTHTHTHITTIVRHSNNSSTLDISVQKGVKEECMYRMYIHSVNKTLWVGYTYTCTYKPILVDINPFRGGFFAG